MPAHQPGLQLDHHLRNAVDVLALEGTQIAEKAEVGIQIGVLVDHRRQPAVLLEGFDQTVAQQLRRRIAPARAAVAAELVGLRHYRDAGAGQRPAGVRGGDLQRQIERCGDALRGRARFAG